VGTKLDQDGKMPLHPHYVYFGEWVRPLVFKLPFGAGRGVMQHPPGFLRDRGLKYKWT
jgi:hypothetical protein